MDAGEGCPIVEQVKERSKRINNTEFTRDDYVVAVRWLHRYAGDDCGLTYVLDAYEHNNHDVVNSTELRATGFDLDKVALPSAPARRTRSRGRNTHRNVAAPCEPDVHYTLDPDIEDAILKQCWAE